MPHRPSPLLLVSLLGAMSVLTPFSIDMYLTAFQQVADDFRIESAAVSLTLSSYFIGLSLGQVFYGPLLDRFGRKKPLYYGLSLFILASIGCAMATDINTLITLRFIQALGGCVAQIASVAMVRDFFPAKDCAKILSRLFLFIAVSPLLAPTIGNFIINVSDWRAVFGVLALVAAAIITLAHFFLPEGHQPDRSISLKPLPILREYKTIATHPRFIIYALAGAFSFAGLFAYIAASPIIFMEEFQLSANIYSGIFALLATGFIGGSQVNVWLLKRFSSEELFFRILIIQVICGVIFAVGTAADWFGLYWTLALFFVYLSCAGLTYPNAAAIAMIPFTKNAGSAAAMLGFIQLGIGSVISSGIGMLETRERFTFIAILAVTSAIGLLILALGRKKAQADAIADS